MEQTVKYSDIWKKMKSDIGEVLSNPKNYFQRFVIFMIITQLLYFFLFFSLQLLAWIDVLLLEKAFIFALVCYCTNLLFLFVFLFKGIQAKALSFFGSGIIYLLLSYILFRMIGIEAGLNNLSFLGGLISWNLLFSVCILLIGTTRTFILGFVYDYSK